MIAPTTRRLWHKPTGRQVEIIQQYGELVRCWVTNADGTRKAQNFSRHSLVSHFGDTKPARVAAHKAIDKPVSECPDCGGRKDADSLRCRACNCRSTRKYDRNSQCDCGKQKYYRSTMCAECRNAVGYTNQRIGVRAYDAVPLPTDEEADLLSTAETAAECRVADAIIKKYRALLDDERRRRKANGEPVFGDEGCEND